MCSRYAELTVQKQIDKFCRNSPNLVLLLKEHIRGRGAVVPLSPTQGSGLHPHFIPDLLWQDNCSDWQLDL